MRGRGAGLFVASAAVALALSACGGSAPHVTPPTKTPVQQASYPAGSEPETTAMKARSNRNHGQQHSESSRASGQAATSGAGGSGTKKTVPVAVPKGPNPCVLVSRMEAEAAVGSSITKITEAPLGPTCILQVQGQKQSITVAVEPAAGADQIHQMRKVRHLAISGHNAYCGLLGRPMLNVPLGNGKVLNVTASCGIAQALAAKALPRIVA
jgi:hypothetical protein